MRLSRPMATCATLSIHSRGVEPWVRPRSNRSECSEAISLKIGSIASFNSSSRAASASRNSTMTAERSATSMRASRKALRKGVGSARARPVSSMAPVRLQASELARPRKGQKYPCCAWPGPATFMTVLRIVEPRRVGYGPATTDRLEKSSEQLRPRHGAGRRAPACELERDPQGAEEPDVRVRPSRGRRRDRGDPG